MAKQTESHLKNPFFITLFLLYQLKKLRRALAQQQAGAPPSRLPLYYYITTYLPYTTKSNVRTQHALLQRF